MGKYLLTKKVWAVVGANQNRDKYGNRIYRTLKEKAMKSMPSIFGFSPKPTTKTHKKKLWNLDLKRYTLVCLWRQNFIKEVLWRIIKSQNRKNFLIVTDG